MQHRFIARPLGVAFARSDVSGIEALLVLERGVCSLEDFVVAKRQQPQFAAADVSDAEIEQYFGFARQIATAMAFLHARGGLHLDQKPANVVLFSTAATTKSTDKIQLSDLDLATLNVAKVVDLGLAVLSRKELEDGFASTAEDGEGGAAAAAALTHITATSLGATIAYASHEQVNAGPGTQVRPTMDVYSFGAILYRLLCVAKPHAGRNAAEILQHKLFDDAMNEDNLLPAFRVANAARTAAAKQLVAVMRMCLQHVPEKRPQTGTEVLKLLLRDDEQLPSELLSAALLSPTSSNMSATLERARSGLTAVGVPSSSSGSSGSNVSVSGQVALGRGRASTSSSLGLVGLQ